MQEVVGIISKISGATFIDDATVSVVGNSLTDSELKGSVRESIQWVLSPEKGQHLTRVMACKRTFAERITADTYLAHGW